MRWLSEVSLIDSGFLLLMATFGFGGAIGLLAVRSARFAQVIVPACVAACAVVVAGAYTVIERWWRPLPDPIPIGVYCWSGIGLCAVVLCVVRLSRSRTSRPRVVVVLSAVAVFAQSASAINAQFAYFPTLASAVGANRVNEMPLLSLPARQADPVPVARWSDPGGLPRGGVVVTSVIAGRVSGFDARPAKIYVPPAYFAARRPLLPVLVLLAGQPGSPQDWLRSGQLAQTMDAYAARHGGLAPVVAVADGTGSSMANPLCVDSVLGNAATYLSVDVPAWIESELQIDSNRSVWAVGGLSYGGTCALQLATNYPAVFPTFLNISGQAEPTLGDRQRTVNAAFGGDAAKFERIDPMNLLRHNRFDNSGGVFVVGDRDKDTKAGLKSLHDAARSAGMTVTYQEVPGGHDFRVWSDGLRTQIEPIATRLGIR